MMRKHLLQKTILLFVSAAVLTMSPAAETPESREDEYVDAIRRITSTEGKTEDGMSVIVEMQYIHNDDNQESAILEAYENNEEKNFLWVYQTEDYEATELMKFELIGVDRSKLYFEEGGKLIAFKLGTGELIWENEDFKGSPVKDTIHISSSGKIYLSGYYGPDLFIADGDGNTITKVNSLKDDSWWPYKSEFTEGDNMRISYESDESSIEFNVTDYFGTIQ